MADDINDQDGGTQENEDSEQGSAETNQTPEGKMYTEAEIASMIDGAKKEAVTVTWSEMQSKADKAIGAANAKEKTATEALADIKKASMDAMSPEDRDRVMLKELYEKVDSLGARPQDGAGDSQSQTQGKPSGSDAFDQSASESVTQARTAASEILEKHGFDTSQVAWGDGKDSMADLDTFIGSLKAKASGSEGDQSSQDGGSASSKGSGNYDNSRGTGGAPDLLTVDPVDLMKRGYAKGGWRKRGID